LIAQEIMQSAKNQFLKISGVTGISSYDDVIVVYVENEEVARQIPFSFMGYSIEVRISGRFRVI